MKHYWLICDLRHNEIEHLLRANDVFLVSEDGPHLLITTEPDTAASLASQAWRLVPWCYCEVREASDEEIEDLL